MPAILMTGERPDPGVKACGVIDSAIRAGSLMAMKFPFSVCARLRTVVLAQSQIRLPDLDTLTPEQLGEETSISPKEERQRQWEAERL